MGARERPEVMAIRRALGLADRYGKLVSLDPNYDPRVWPDKEEAWEVIAEIMPHVTVVKPSLEDARSLFDPNMATKPSKMPACASFTL